MDRKVVCYSNELYHYGVSGQKWGVRNYQNEDGSYKPGAEGRYYDPVGGVRRAVRKITGDRDAKRAAKESYRVTRKKLKDDADSERQANYNKYLKKYAENPKGKFTKEEAREDSKKYEDNEAKIRENYSKNVKEAKKAYKEEMAKAGGLSDKQKIALTVGAAVAVAGLAAYATYKISQKNSSAIKEAFDKSRAKGENFLNRLEVDYLSDHSYTDNKYFYSKFENPYASSLKELTDKYDKNLFNRLTKRDSTDLAGYSVLREISGHYDEAKNRVVSETKSMINGTTNTFNGGTRRGLWNHSEYQEYLARKRK